MNREEFKKKAKQTIDDVFAKIDELEQKSIAELRTDAKENYHRKIEDLKDKKEELKKKYEELEKTTEDKWATAKEEFSKSAGYFRNAILEIASIFGREEEYEEDEFIEVE